MLEEKNNRNQWDMDSRRVRTDLALELQEDVGEQNLTEGISVSEHYDKAMNLKRTHIRVLNQKGQEMLGKPIGNYITLESDSLCDSDKDIHRPFVEALYQVLTELVGAANRILVIGLGNRAVTPDALGPLVVDHLYITRHLIKEGLVKRAREISAICPGVMAQTGIESSTIIASICQEIKPEVVIAIDALAAREPSRLNTTIQICDTGITPGAGVGNHRLSLNREVLGVPVVAIGVPTVISVPSIVHQAIGVMVDRINEGGNRLQMEYTEEELQSLAWDLLDEKLASMFVTPKNIDETIHRVSYTISEAINHFLV